MFVSTVQAACYRFVCWNERKDTLRSVDEGLWVLTRDNRQVFLLLLTAPYDVLLGKTTDGAKTPGASRLQRVVASKHINMP